jgi:NitT/TauT family transport system ATP-binding protein
VLNEEASDMEGRRRPSARPASVRPPAARGRLEFLDVHKNFSESGVPALRGVTLACTPGEFVVVVGPSGCGKSTLLNLAAGTLSTDQGKVTLDGKPVEGPGPDRAMVFQEHGLFPWLNAADNIAFGLKMAGVPKAERDDRVAAALRAVHLSNAGKKLVHELSGGMRQRIAIARALVLDPAVLLMDEPFAALDAQTRTSLHQHLQDLWCTARKTILFVTHSVGEAVRLADRVVILHANPGRIRKEVPIELAHPRHFDSLEVTELVSVIRTEIEREVLRVHEEASSGSAIRETIGDLGSADPELGGGL